MNATLTAQQDQALTALVGRALDFFAAGIDRFGSPEAFLAALKAYDAEKAA